MYGNDFVRKHNVRQATCYFTCYDPVRETFCLIVEDMNEANYTGGDQLSGGPGKDEPPHEIMFLSVMDSLATFNAKSLNTTKKWWEGKDVNKVVLPLNAPFFKGMWPVLTGAIIQTAPDTFADAGILPKDDPAWDQMRVFVKMQAEFYDATAICKEEGGLYNATFCHGDARSENIFFPKSRVGAPALIDFQLLKRFLPPFDAYYFMITSVPTEWRREYEVPLLNVFYDVFVEQSGSDPLEYTWELFILELQITVPFYVNAFLFLANDVNAQMDETAPGFDQRKKDLLWEMCERCKDTLQEWMCFDKMEELLQTMIDRKTAHEAKTLSSAWVAESVETWVPAKWREGRDPQHYVRWKEIKSKF
eukprot:SAG31_NODE_4901_length_2877_cov_1.289777_2_plen_362_part_00